MKDKSQRDKLEWRLVPWDGMYDVVRVLMNGRDKYGEANWQQQDPDLFRDAAWRHMMAWNTGHWFDDAEDGSGLPHVAHIIANLLIYMWHIARRGGVS